MNDSKVLSQGPLSTNNADFYISNKDKAMKSKDLEKYFGALKDCTILDEIRAQVIKMRESQD